MNQEAYAIKYQALYAKDLEASLLKHRLARAIANRCLTGSSVSLSEEVKDCIKGQIQLVKQIQKERVA